MNRYWKPPQAARIEPVEMDGDGDYAVDGVVAVCLLSGCRGEETFGTSQSSERRALLTLTRRCTCGARYHAGGRR